MKKLIVSIALAFSVQAYAQTATPLPGSILVDQVAVRASVNQVQTSLGKALQDALNLQKANGNIETSLYQASLAVSIAKLSADGATLAQATQKLNSDASPILTANNKAVQKANQTLLDEQKAGNYTRIEAAKVELERAAKQAALDQATIFGTLAPSITDKIQASISRVLRNALKLGADLIAGNKVEVELDKVALSKDFTTLVNDMGVVAPKNNDNLTQLAKAADNAVANMSQENKAKLEAFAKNVDVNKVAAQITTAAASMSQENKDRLAQFLKGK